MKRLAKEAGVITQMGKPGAHKRGLALDKEWYDAGILGQIEDIYIWTNPSNLAAGRLVRSSGAADSRIPRP